MPMVFVHGVGVRKGPGYDGNVAARSSLIKRFCLKKIVPNWQKFEIGNPYWGGDAAKFYWDHASIPKGKHEQLGEQESSLIIPVLETAVALTDRKAILVSVARARGLTEAIDLLWTLATAGHGVKLGEDMALLAEKALEVAERTPNPEWLPSVADDQTFIGRLREEVDKNESKTDIEILGVREAWEGLRETASRIALIIPSEVSKDFLTITRRWLHVHITTFLGDAMVYLNERGSPEKPGPIVQRVLTAIDEADALRQRNGEPLYLMGHSMGGNILYDILTWFRPRLSVDALITVGSQPPLFEELKLFGVSDKKIPANVANDRVPKRAEIGRWINVFDLNDILSFEAARIFDGVRDFAYETGAGLATAHISYLNRPSFQSHLGARIREGMS